MPKKKTTGQKLRERGFDLTTFNLPERTYRVRCSQCEALVINGIACHERGCPNEIRDDEEEGS